MKLTSEPMQITFDGYTLPTIRKAIDFAIKHGWKIIDEPEPSKKPSEKLPVKSIDNFNVVNGFDVVDGVSVVKILDELHERIEKLESKG